MYFRSKRSFPVLCLVARGAWRRLFLQNGGNLCHPIELGPLARGGSEMLVPVILLVVRANSRNLLGSLLESDDPIV